MSTKYDLDINKPNDGPARVYTEFSPLDGHDRGVRIWIDWDNLLGVDVDEQGVEIVLTASTFKKYAHQIACCRIPT